ncbi:hypothetical protein [Micrococcus porci]|uniref:hypothetical protein n=1 Tax=Micrococcus porci TaxID=2856555 RepID=UPI003CEECB36
MTGQNPHQDPADVVAGGPSDAEEVTLDPEIAVGIQEWLTQEQAKDASLPETRPWA